jgi:uncharacterized protein YjiS (DUF1127 family)
MSSTTQSNVRNIGTIAGHGILSRLGTGVRAAFDAYVRQRERRAVEAELAALPDWTLDDIGLARSDIHRVAESIVGKLHAAGPGPDGRPPKIRLQSVTDTNPLAAQVRVICGGAPSPVGCG